jgi:hydrogenase maturation protein HypF
LESLPEITAAPFHFPLRFSASLRLARQDSCNFPTTSMGRLFDTVAALLGFTNAVTFEGQAAIWLEQVARKSPPVPAYSFPLSAGCELDFRPLLQSVMEDRLRQRAAPEIARAFHGAIARGISQTASTIREESGAGTVVLSGGVFQNELLLAEVNALLEPEGFRIWTNSPSQ